MRVFLTGATGYLGGEIARQLVDAGHTVAVLVRDRARAASLVGAGAILVDGDLTRPEEWASSLEAAEGLIHTAGLVASWGDGAAFDRINRDAAVELADRARAAGLSRVVMTGSLFALGPTGPDSPLDEHAVDLPPGRLAAANHYVRSKGEAMRALRDLQRRGNPLMMTFPTVLLGPGHLTAGNHTAQVLADIGRGRFPGLVGSGDQVWNLVPVAQAAVGHVRALERGVAGENYILGGENWTQRRLVERAAHYFGRKPPTRRLGTRVPSALAAMLEAVSAVTGKSPYLTRGEVALYEASWAFSSDKAVSEMGYQTGDVEATVSETVRWLRETVWQ